jgi:very-short-patch-repair endonuclease/tRNA(Ile)-lysidine synthase TilS/MesJ
MLTTQDLLNKSRNELLDLSTRNRLLSIPVNSKSARIVQVFDELSEEVYRLLVTEKKSFAFLPGRKSKNETEGEEAKQEVEDEVGLPQPDEEEDISTGLAKRHVDLKLQTSLSPEGIQRRLLDLYHDARTMIEEQGVNILYLSLGQLKWFEAEHSDTPRFAPLVLIPVELTRKTATERFILQWTGDDIEENLSLQAKLKNDFGIELPQFPNEENFSPQKYFDSVAKAITSAKTWEVIPNGITLGFFSFAKFLMYRDLAAENWPNLDQLLKQPLITGLLQDGFPQSESFFTDDTHIDEVIPASKLDHVVDADSSQTLAIEAVRQGQSHVIQGPPGTGKSQSITNIIATAVLDGKKVLFVAEKLAALEVVKRRLEKEGLGALCLELHSNKSNKRAVIEEIGRTWKLGRPRASDLESLIPKLEQKRNVLNNHVSLLHEKHDPSGLTPFSIIGHLAVLGDRGMPAAEFTFAEAETWTAEQRRNNRKLIEELAQRIEQIGLPAEHPWRGACRETVLNIDLDPLLKRVRSVIMRVSELGETSSRLAAALAQSVPETIERIEEQRIIADYVGQAPPLDKQALCNSVWNAGLEGLRDLIADGRKFAAANQQVKEKFVETVWQKDFTGPRGYIAAHGKSLFRFLNGKYRNAITEIRGCMTSELSKEYSERLTFIDALISGQQALKKIQENDPTAREAFGTTWRKEKTDWDQLEIILKWVSRQNEAGLGASFRQMFAAVNDQANVIRLVEELSSRISASREEIQNLFAELSLDCSIAFSVDGFESIPIESLIERCRLWIEKPEELSRWNNYFVRARQARAQGLASLIELLESGKTTPAAAVDCFDRIYFSQLLRSIVRKKPELAQFDGALHEKHVSEFKQLDIERLALAKYRTLVAHYERLPQFNAGVGAAGIVKSEMERKRGHRTVRRLLKDAGSVVQAIKPVFMMSPLSVAQFLEPGAVEFDLLVIDEASQVQPVDALGAIARCKQIVVVGDSKQLPPTRFFSRITSNGESEEDEEAEQPQVAQAQDIESILGLCRARGLPEKMLRWHYRSRHHSLIAVSNHEFYDDKLFIVPSPYSAAAGLGLKFNHVPDGVFDSGASGTNRIEAKVVCRAIIEHGRKHPEQTLGVAAFSVRQQQAIIDELELLRRENPDTERFFSDHSTEPFFVKNLENVQGDERDVIFISVGYARDVHGYMAMRFGPLGAEGGERRLNVLISRAKKRCEVFSSITADDIDLGRAFGRGVAALKTFLSFAQTGRLSVAKISGREEDSPFEEAVRRAIQSLGYEVDPQVGVAGFFIDLAVMDRENRGRYLLGIECDGAAYHSSRSARDRDRLRQTVLEDHGWIMHRIWSTDWFQRPSEQLRKVAAAIERAKTVIEEIKADASPVISLSVSVESEDGIERETVLELSNANFVGSATHYTQAQFEVPTRVEPYQLETKDVAAILLKIVECEGPIHENEIVNRVRDLWGFSRAGARIQDSVAKGVRSLLITKQCAREDGFLFLLNVPIPVRNRELVSSPDLRKPEMLPPMEIRAAILSVIDVGHGATKAEIPTAVARMFGFKNTSSQLRTTIEAQMIKLIRQSILSDASGMLKRIEKTVTSLN